MIWNALTHMIKIKIFTHLVHYRLFGENDFCWQWWEEPVRPIFLIYGKLSFSLIEERAQSKSSSDNDAFVHVHNKNVITLHWKKSLVVMINHPSFQIYLLWFFFLFQFFLKRAYLLGSDTCWWLCFYTRTQRLSNCQVSHQFMWQQTNKWTNKQTNE